MQKGRDRRFPASVVQAPREGVNGARPINATECSVANGAAVGVVVATGMRTEIGTRLHLGHHPDPVDAPPGPQRQIDRDWRLLPRAEPRWRCGDTWRLSSSLLTALLLFSPLPLPLASPSLISPLPSVSMPARRLTGKIQAHVQEAAEDQEKTPLGQKIDAFGELLAKVRSPHELRMSSRELP